jgi:hypothetical protein
LYSNHFVFRANENPVISTGWHRVTLTQSAKYSKEVVLQALANALSLRSLTLEPIAFKLQGTHYSFYVSTVNIWIRKSERQTFQMANLAYTIFSLK